MRGKGEGAIYRVPKDRKQPLIYWVGTVELPPIDGKRRKITRRNKDKVKLVGIMDDLRAQLKTRGDLPTANQTVEQWFTYWYETFVLKERKPKTAAGYKSVVFGHIVPEIGHVKLNKLTPAHIRRVHDRMALRNLSSTYALNAHRIMSASLEIAVRENRIGVNVAKRMSAPRKAAIELDVLNIDEAIRVLEHVSQMGSNGARWATALLTGARRGEVLGLEYDRVTDELDLSWQLQRLPLAEKTGIPVAPADFEYRHLSGGLYLTRPKAEKSRRIIPLVDPLRSILQRHIETSDGNPYGLVFTIDNKPIDPDRDSSIWRDVLRETGIQKRVRLHDLRHAAVDMLYLAGVPEDLIMEIVGHSTRSVTRGYKARANRERLIAAMRQMSALYTRSPGASEGKRATIES